MKGMKWLVIIVLGIFLCGCAAVLGPSPRVLRGEIARLEGEKEILTGERDAYKAEAEFLAEEIRGFEAQLGVLRDSLAHERGKVKALETEVVTLDRELRCLRVPEAIVFERPGRQTREFIRQIQLALRAAGYEPGPIDGIKGSRTRRAVREFQRAYGLRVDGIVGRETWGRLEKYVRRK